MKAKPCLPIRFADVIAQFADALLFGARCEKVGTGLSRKARSKFLESIMSSAFERFGSNAA